MMPGMTKRARIGVLTALYAFGFIILALQPAQFLLSDKYNGLLPYKGEDESMYLVRLQEGLTNPLGQVSNGIWSQGNPPPGLQQAGMERILGVAFSWSGINASWLALLVTLFITPLVLVLSTQLFRRAGVPFGWACIASVIFFIAIGYARRYPHPAWSLPATLTALLLLWRWYEDARYPKAILAGISLGLLTYVYLWSWTFAWAFAGLLCLAGLLGYKASPRMGLKSMIVLWIAVLIAAWPFISTMLGHSVNPLFAEASARAGLAYTHWPESIPRSIITAIVAVAAVILWTKKGERKEVIPLVCLCIASAVVYSQSIVHGKVMSFSSHYVTYFLLTAALLCARVILKGEWKTIAGSIAVIAALIFAIPAMWDSGGRVRALRAPSGAQELGYLHVAGAFTYLSREPVGTVLTDRYTADNVAIHTKHDVIFTEYTGHLLISDAEYADRFCTSEMYSTLPAPVPTLIPVTELHLRVLRGQETQANYEAYVQKIEDRCAEVRRDTRTALDTYQVDYVLWNEKTRPDWKPSTRDLKRVRSGSGWSLWAPVTR